MDDAFYKDGPYEWRIVLDGKTFPDRLRAVKYLTTQGFSISEAKEYIRLLEPPD